MNEDLGITTGELAVDELAATAKSVAWLSHAHQREETP